MKADVLQKWITALRSGRYRQVKGFEGLITNDVSYKYCAVGVLGKVFEKETGIDPFVPLTAGRREPALQIKNDRFTAWVGTTYWPPRDKESWSIIETALNANDDGSSFGEIANILEQKYGMQTV